ncbi:MAG: 2,3,4,5-tetrahydropyridine-2,6-dicarboxylate N-succinyltransferase, partial [Planctomycetes bacterium]|nr:2,3,4,5-tetrahydropyridine-2,6-dicarboxylate N-succinyltransferase [Planctomycetota bacterium]
MTEPLEGEALLDALESGQVRAAFPQDGTWVVPAWVKQGILDIFRTSAIEPAGIELRHGSELAFRDKDAFPVQRFSEASGVRLVPGGSAVRRGAHLAQGVVCMPPMYVNVGAFVGENSMVDSHALVGSCAQIGARVHLSAAVQIGGVLEPVGARPVIVEDDAFIGGSSGIYEGVFIGAGAVIAAGV